MCENICRVCAKNIKGIDALELFKSHNKILLVKIKDLTGVRLRNSIGLPKLMCSDCNKDLLDAYKFREDFLKVQSSFKLHITRGNKKSKLKHIIEQTEFVQVLAVKEEKEETKIGNREHIFIQEEEEEEREINFTKKNNLSLEKECIEEINALELKPNEENTLEDTKVSIVNKDDVNTNNIEHSTEEKEILSDFDEEAFRESDEDYSPTVGRKEILRRTNCKRKENGNNQSNRRGAKTSKGEVVKTRKKRKDSKEHPKLFICDQCGNHFTCRHHFKLHLRRHSGDKRCACELCPDKFFTSSELRRHMRRHTGERPFACKFCDRRFTDYSTRIKHERTHTNERPFMCSQCGKSFTTSYILKNHMLTHTGERHFKCDVCNKAFTRRTHLVVHFRSIMHKQAVEKDKRPESQEELNTDCLIQPQTHVNSFLV